MTNAEKIARQIIRSQNREDLLRMWEDTTTNDDPEIYTLRGWIMDEISSRYPARFDAWLEDEESADESFREYINKIAA